MGCGNSSDIKEDPGKLILISLQKQDIKIKKKMIRK